MCLGGLNTLQQTRAHTPTPSLDNNKRAKKELERGLKLQVAILASLYQFHSFDPLVSSLTRRRNMREEISFLKIRIRAALADIGLRGLMLEN